MAFQRPGCVEVEHGKPCRTLRRFCRAPGSVGGGVNDRNLFETCWQPPFWECEQAGVS
jgi:hypothetical protein